MAKNTTDETKVAPKEEARALYSRAGTVLRERHREEFQSILTDLHAEAGYVYSPRPSKEERARREIERLIAENPDLGLTVVPATGADGS